MKMIRQDQGFWISGGSNIALSKIAIVFGFQNQGHSIVCICKTVKLSFDTNSTKIYDLSILFN